MRSSSRTAWLQRSQQHPWDHRRPPGCRQQPRRGPHGHPRPGPAAGAGAAQLLGRHRAAPRHERVQASSLAQVTHTMPNAFLSLVDFYLSIKRYYKTWETSALNTDPQLLCQFLTCCIYRFLPYTLSDWRSLRGGCCQHRSLSSQEQEKQCKQRGSAAPCSASRQPRRPSSLQEGSSLPCGPPGSACLWGGSSSSTRHAAELNSLRFWGTAIIHPHFCQAHGLLGYSLPSLPAGLVELLRSAGRKEADGQRSPPRDLPPRMRTAWMACHVG